MLVAHRRIELDITVAAFRDQVLDIGIAELPIDGEIAIAAAELPDRHKDPADRLLVATATTNGLTLLTADDVLLEWKLRGLRLRDATD